MRVLITGDWQVGVQNLTACELTVQQILAVIKERDIQVVVHAGDTKNAFNPVDVRVTNFLVDAAQRISSVCRLLVLLGNHDRAGPLDSAHSALPVMAAAGAETIEDPKLIVLALGTKNTPLYGLAAVPYIRDTATQQKAFSQIAAQVARRTGRWLLVFHCELRGSYYTVEVPNQKSDALTVSDIAPERYVTCIGGHIHYPQQVADNVYYVGSPFCQDWGDANQQKRLLVVDLVTSRVVSIASCVPGWYDPSMRRFQAPTSWEGCRVRIHAIGDQPLPVMLEQAQTAYPGAHIQAVVSPPNGHSSDELDLGLRLSDRELIERFLATRKDLLQREQHQIAAYLSTKLREGTCGIPAFQFLKARGINVLCFRRASLALDEPGIHLVTGINRDWAGRSNGSGKSSLLALPLIALFGSTPKGQTADRWSRQRTRDKAWVEVTLRLPDGRRLRIRRVRRPPQLKIWLDGKDISMGDVRATQQLIERLTGLTWDVVVHSLYVGQREISTILVGTDRERKELFGRFLGLERFLRAQEDVRRDIRRREVWGPLTAIEKEICATERKIAAERITEVREGLVKVSKEELCQIRQALLEVRTTLRARRKELRLVKSEDVRRREKRSRLMLKKGMLEEKNRLLEKAIEEVRALKGTCPLCGSLLGKDAIAKRLATLRQERIRVAQADERLRELDRKAKDLAVAAITRETACNTTIRRLEASIYDLHKRWVELREQRKAFVAGRREASKLVGHVRLLARRFRTHEDFERWLWEEKRFLENALSVVSRDGLPAYLCGLVCPALNAEAKRTADLFSEGAIRVEFSLAEGDLDVSLVNVYGGQRVEDQSEGEMRLAALTVAFTFRAVLARGNLLILDEPGEGLDQYNAALLARGLNTMVTTGGTIFVTTHNPNIIAELEPTCHYEVEKQGGVSQVRRLQ